MNSTSTVRRTAVAVGAAAVLGMGVLGACGTKEKDKPAETSPPASSSATAPATPTEKAVGPGAFQRASSACLQQHPGLSGYRAASAQLPDAPTCLCGEAERDSGGSWVCCDTCSSWCAARTRCRACGPQQNPSLALPGRYHVRCQGVTTAAAKTMKKYVCNICLALKPNCAGFEGVTGEDALNRIHKTKSPPVEVLHTQMLAAQKLEVEGKAEAELGAALVSYEVSRGTSSLTWTRRAQPLTCALRCLSQVAAAAANEALDRHMAAMGMEGRLAPEDGDVLEEKHIRALVQAALTCEVSSPALAEEAMLALKTLKWRGRVDNLLGAPASLQTVAQLLKVL